MTQLANAFLPPKKKAKKGISQKAYFFKMTHYYIIIYLFIIYYAKQQNAFICVSAFGVIALSHRTFSVYTPNNQAQQVTFYATQQPYPTSTQHLTTTHRSYYHYHHSVTEPLSY